MSRPLPDEGELRAMLDALRDRGLDELAELVVELVAAERARNAIEAEAGVGAGHSLLVAAYLHGLAERIGRELGPEERVPILQCAVTLARLGGSPEIATFIERDLDPTPGPDAN